MDRLTIDVGRVYTLTILSHQPYFIDTDRGQAPCLRVRSGNQELEWVVAKKAFEQLQELLGAASWAGRTINVTKVREGNITRIRVSLNGPTPAPEVSSPVETVVVASPGEEITAVQGSQNLVRQVVEHARPYSIEVTRGQRGSYGYTLKVRSSTIGELVDDLRQALTLVRMVLEEEIQADKNGGKNAGNQYTDRED